ncbi:unnamed protein product [Rangifer tarandus platyrhynchus]|uniref:Uncharacterized protein n=1 Tax=Rangifer tarandus platyrhynchus TaxID=3082113 RepID=A0AC59ZEV7_RANTA
MNVGGILSILFELNGMLNASADSLIILFSTVKILIRISKERNYKFNLKIYRAKYVFKVCFKKVKPIYVNIYMCVYVCVYIYILGFPYSLGTIKTTKTKIP